MFKKLSVLIVTAFVDMVGLLMVLPLMPFYARYLGAGSLVVTVLVVSFTAAQLLSAPLWGRFSDRYGRRPALIVGLGSAAIAYVVFGFATSIWLILLSRIIQGAGGGTVGVIQAYVADATEPNQRAKALGWLSAATSVGVALGPPLGSAALSLWGRPGPGVFAAILCVVNILFCYMYLPEARDMVAAKSAENVPRTSKEAVIRVFTHPQEAAPKLIWIYAIAMGAFQGMTAILALFLADRFGLTPDKVWIFFTYIGTISFVTRAGILGRLVDKYGEERIALWGLVFLCLGLATMPLARALSFPLPGFETVTLSRYFVLASSIALLPVGTAFTFPCVTSMLSRVISANERGLYMGVQQTFGGLGRIIVPLWAGFAYDRFGKTVPFFTSSLLVLIAITLSYRVNAARRTQRIAEPVSELVQ
ncbi:MAG: MFS transporter [Gemmatimonadaceae bacterium]|nr:MFS transporter [Gemmatimonadaceae bacterium]